MRRLFFVVLMLFIPCATFAQEKAELTLVKTTMQDLQQRSVNDNLEYCGFIGYDPRGQIRATIALAGGRASCWSQQPDKLRVVASYHTHAAYDPAYFGEVPSTQDMESDAQQGIDGYVSTPGGRLWFIDTDRNMTYQICGPGCLPQDPNFELGQDGPIAQSYTYSKLGRLLGN
jgi:hypothetical protein